MLGDPNYVGIIPVHIRMALIFQDFPIGSGLNPVLLSHLPDDVPVRCVFKQEAHEWNACRYR